MKSRFTIVGIVVVAIGLTAFGLSKNPNVNVNEGEILCGHTTAQLDSNEKFTPETETETELFMASTDLSFRVRANYIHPITLSELKSAKTLGALVSSYPGDLISEHISVNILANDMQASATNDLITKEQKQLIDALKIGDNININVLFKSENALTEEIEDGEMNISVTVVPDVEAEYVEGYDEMIDYFRNNVRNGWRVKSYPEIPVAKATFKIDESGQIQNVELIEPSFDNRLNDLFIKLIKKMPKWKPAESAEGVPASQEFEISIMGLDGC